MPKWGDLIELVAEGNLSIDRTISTIAYFGRFGRKKDLVLQVEEIAPSTLVQVVSTGSKRRVQPSVS
jgi:hypothetical protein